MLLVYIHWRDACTEAADDPNTPVTEHPLVDLYEVGWLIGETDDSLSLSMEYVPKSSTNLLEPGGKPGRWRLHVPKCNIIDRKNFETDKLFAVKPTRKRIAAPKSAVKSK